MRELEAGESRYIAAATKRIKEMSADEAKVALLREDDFIAAQILNDLPARLSGQILLALPVDRYSGISKALKAVAAIEARKPPTKKSR